MKANAITRIILYSVVIVALVGILIAGLNIDLFLTVHHTHSGTTLTHTTHQFESADISKLKLDWASGTVLIRIADQENITVSVSDMEDQTYPVRYQVSGGTLHLDYTISVLSVSSIPTRDITITVPEHWICGELEVDAADLDLVLDRMTIQNIDLDGADCFVSMTGSFDTLDCDGAACELWLTCDGKPSSIDIDGVDCKLDLWVSESCGFRVDMDGLDCNFTSPLSCNQTNGVIQYGDGHCDISVDGVSCDVVINDRDYSESVPSWMQ